MRSYGSAGLGNEQPMETTMKHLNKVTKYVMKHYGDLEDDDLGRAYEECLNARQTDDEKRKLLAAEWLAEWVKHHEQGAYAN